MREIIDPKLVDWSDCSLVERNPLKLSGVPIVKHTRVQADSIVENYESGSPVEEIADNFRISEGDHPRVTCVWRSETKPNRLVKVLFDHNVPFGLRKPLADHAVSLADEMGWAEIGNGELLRRAEEAGFEIMLTCDQNLIYQQNLANRQIALVIFNTNNWKLIQRDIRLIVQAIDTAEPGSFRFLKFGGRITNRHYSGCGTKPFQRAKLPFAVMRHKWP